MSDEEDKKPFIHSNGDSQFKSRSNAVFDALAGLERKHEQETSKHDPFAEDISADKTRRQKHRLPQRIPDHVLHPQKWTKYSLKEDGSSNLSGGLKGNNLNSNIPMKFVDNLKQRNKDEIPAQEDLETDEKLCFHRPVNLKRKIDETDDDTSNNQSHDENKLCDTNLTHGNVVRMKAFEFGQKTEGTRSKKIVSETSTSKELALPHLEDENEQEKEDSLDQKSHINDTDTKIGADEKECDTLSKFKGKKHSRKNMRQFHPEDID